VKTPEQSTVGHSRFLQGASDFDPALSIAHRHRRATERCITAGAALCGLIDLQERRILLASRLRFSVGGNRWHTTGE